VYQKAQINPRQAGIEPLGIEVIHAAQVVVQRWCYVAFFDIAECSHRCYTIAFLGAICGPFVRRAAAKLFFTRSFLRTVV